LRTLAVALITMVTGRGPQENVITPPAATARTTACEVQLAGVPWPTTWSGWAVLTAGADGPAAPPPARGVTAAPLVRVALAAGVPRCVRLPRPGRELWPGAGCDDEGAELACTTCRVVGGAVPDAPLAVPHAARATADASVDVRTPTLQASRMGSDGSNVTIGEGRFRPIRPRSNNSRARLISWSP
jgi:hypothetical protein